MSLNSDTNMGEKNCTDKNSCMMAYCHYRYQYLYGISVSGICIDKCICIGSPLISWNIWKNKRPKDGQK